MTSGRTEDRNNPGGVRRFLRATLIGRQSADFIKASGRCYRVNRPIYGSSRQKRLPATKTLASYRRRRAPPPHPAEKKGVPDGPSQWAQTTQPEELLGSGALRQSKRAPRPTNAPRLGDTPANRDRLYSPPPQRAGRYDAPLIRAGPVNIRFMR